MSGTTSAAKRDILERVRRGDIDPEQAIGLLRALTGASDDPPPPNGATAAAAPEAAETALYEVAWTRAARQPGPPTAAPRPLRLTPAAPHPHPAAPALLLDGTDTGTRELLDAASGLMRQLIADRSRPPAPLVVLTTGERASTADAVGALCQIAGEEDRRLRAVALHVTRLPADVSSPEALAAAELQLPTPGGAQVRYDEEGRWERTLRPLPPPPRPATVPWRDRGVYLITGGGGGTGARLAELLARRHAARLVLMARSAASAATRDLLDRIRRLGGHAVYLQGDVARRADTERAVALARAEYGPLNGVLHAAGVNEDSYLVNKTPESFHRVLTPKLDGTAALDAATVGEPLDLFVLFSSVSAWIGGPGQADYAAANRGLGGAAAARADAVAQGSRRGTTVSVALPLLAGGGMDLGERDKRQVRDVHGMVAMPPETTLRAIEAALGCGRPDVFVGHGDIDLLATSLARRLAPRPPGDGDAVAEPGAARPETPAAPDAAAGELRTAVERHLLDLISDLIRLPRGRLGVDQEFSEVGIDSVLIKRISTQLEDRLGELPATLLFEHRTVAELTRHLLGSHRARLSELVGPQPPAAPAAPAGNAALAGNAAPAAGQPAAMTEPHEPSPTPDPAEPIAIVGVAGRYPGGEDLDAYWDTLRNGRDAVTEVPSDRWDHARYYAPGERTEGRTYGRWGGFLNDIARFDALYFGVSPREAERADPAERIFLEVAWAALEDAGYSRRALQEATRRGEEHAVGVFVGVTGTSYKLIGAEEWGRENRILAYSMDFSIANRLSYLLDAHGPSLVVDTACSSSLTALHLACESLRRGECRMAVTGGTHIQVHPIKYGVLADMRLLSTDGRCRAFGAGGDGFVPGEGAGALILKPLTAALADGDHVHGVIRGTAVNHGGRTNGYTVPSPRAHAAVIAAAHARAGVSADTIGYVEAHGTGTALGDPVEMAGLRQAFGEDAGEPGGCAIGSVKSNIGHLESAAGVAGITKVLLQFRHRELVPTLHCDEPNPRIDFEGSVFALQRRVAPWAPRGQGVPLRAAVSSFGAGGANGHVVLEEPPPAARRPEPDGEGPQLILLSAKTDERLAEVARRLLSHLLADRREPFSLREVAYSLMVGRDPLESRLAVTARSVPELCARLKEYLASGDAPGLVTGRVEGPPTARPDDERHLVAARDWPELARRWVNGGDGAWESAFGQDRPRRVPLPTYPFAGRRHWVATTPPLDGRPAPGPGRSPLDRCVPSLGPAVHEADLDPGTPVIADHRVHGDHVLAGVVHLLMAVAAAESLGRGTAGAVTDVRWRSPLRVAPEGTTARIAVEEAADGLRYTLSSDATTRSTGTVELAADSAPPSPPLDIAAVRARCEGPTTRGTGFHAAAQAAGVAYGPLFQRMANLTSGSGEALADLSPPSDGDAPGWAVDAGMLDSALHAVHGVLPEAFTGTALLPASVARVDFRGPASHARHAHVRLLAHDTERGTARVDVTLTDASGARLVDFHDLLVARPSAAGASVVHLRPAWRTLTDPVPAPGPTPPATLVLTTCHDHGLGARLADRVPGARVIDVGAPDAAARLDEALRDLADGTHVYALGGVDDRISSPHDLDHLERAEREGCLELLRVARSLADRRPRGVRVTVVTTDVQQIDDGTPARNPFAAALPGLAKALGRELPFVEVACLDLARDDLVAEAALERALDAVIAEPPARPVSEVARRGGVRLVRTLRRVRLPEPADDDLPLVEGGTYLIVGGTGGLGRAVSRFLAGACAPRLVLVGRRPLEALPHRLLGELREAGAETAVYERADVADPEAMRAVVARVRERFGAVNGAVHAAFTLADRGLAHMDEDTFRSALTAKARGTAVLAAALALEPLDFLALFSSAVSHRGNAGQSNYAAASTFQDAFGRYLAARGRLPVTVINWGLWGESGSVATEDYRRRVARLGVAGLSDAEGVAAFRRALAAPLTQVTALKAVDPEALEGVENLPAQDIAAPGAPSAALPALAGAVEAARTSPPPPDPDHLDLLDAFARRSALDVLQGAGYTGDASADLARLSVVPAGRRLFHALRAALTASAAGRPDTAADLRKRLLTRYPFTRPAVELITACAEALPDVLAGRRRGVEVLFPGGDDRRMAGLYGDDPRSRHFNAVCVGAVTGFLAQRPSWADGGPEPAILEIGAGTGGTTGPLLAALRDSGTPVRYDCTDISAALVRRAEERFGQHPRARFRTLDIAADPGGQGFAVGGHDVVVAPDGATTWWWPPTCCTPRPTSALRCVTWPRCCGPAGCSC